MAVSNVAVTVDLQSILTIMYIYGIRQGLCQQAKFGSLKGHLKVIARAKFYKFK